MLYALTVPGAADDVSEVRVLEWHGKAGHAFAKGDLMVELETHKAVIEVRAGIDAILRRIVKEPGDWQQTGAQLAILSSAPDEPVPDDISSLAEIAALYEVV